MGELERPPAGAIVIHDPEPSAGDSARRVLVVAPLVLGSAWLAP